jgi:ATP-dependent Clp protease ATP-binding subunit ClpC
LHSKKINTEHLLLAITGPHGEGVAARALQNLGLDFKNVRATVIEILKRQIVHSSQDVI